MLNNCENKDNVNDDDALNEITLMIIVVFEQINKGILVRQNYHSAVHYAL